MAYRLAVDLGTAYSAAAIVNGAPPAILSLGNRAMQIPSALFLQPDGLFLVGEAAERRGVWQPELLVREFKRRFGDPVPFLVGGRPYSTERLMAELLQWIWHTACDLCGDLPAELIVTCPANWGPYKRELLRQVADIAGLPPAHLCTEPEAAAAHYAARAHVKSGDVIAVYDFGGGTFDACRGETGQRLRHRRSPDRDRTPRRL